MANPAMTLISSQTLGGTTASVTFSSIPSTYNDLKLVISARGDTAAFNISVVMKLNGDTATNYSQTYLEGTPNSSFSGRSTGVTADSFYININGANTTASTFGSAELYFPNYNSTSAKPYNFTSVTETNSTSNAFIFTEAGLYRGASGIFSITLTPNSGNFVQYSDFYLYGIKNS